MDAIKLIFFHLLPKNLMSQLFGILARVELIGFSSAFKNIFIKLYKIDTEEAEKPVSEYPTAQAFFGRKLKPELRPIADSNIVSSVDGKLSQCGVFTDLDYKMIQAKGRSYSLKTLLPDLDESLLEKFLGGNWATIYLAPYDYHRIHTPVSGTIKQAWYQPGTLWPVNQWSVNNIDKLFCINEKITTHIEVSPNKHCLVVKIGATNVGRISLSYTEDIVSNTSKTPDGKNDFHWLPKEEMTIKKGDELGAFELGSTVIIICSKELHKENEGIFLSYLDKKVKMGQAL